jgi:hypothetical protein
VEKVRLKSPVRKQAAHPRCMLSPTIFVNTLRPFQYDRVDWLWKKNDQKFYKIHSHV